VLLPAALFTSFGAASAEHFVENEMTNAAQERPTLADLQKSVEYQVLHERHKVFFDVLIARAEAGHGWDYHAATLAAYPACAANHESQIVRSSQIKANPAVRRVLGILFGWDMEPLDPVMVTLRAALCKAIKHDIAATGTISEPTAASLKVYESKTGKKLKAGKTNAK
jgi:hypothetical protein